MLEELSLAHTAIFCGPGPHVAPYGSVYHPDEGGQGMLWGKTTAWIRRFALDHGLEFEGPGYRGIPDEASVEFELIYRLLARQADLLEMGRLEKACRIEASLARLVGDHTLPWAAGFCDAVVAFSAGLKSRLGAAFYAGLARLAKDLVEDEGRRLGLDARGGQAAQPATSCDV